jgi:hypothetical protein
MVGYPHPPGKGLQNGRASRQMTADSDSISV